MTTIVKILKKDFAALSFIFLKKNTLDRNTTSIRAHVMILPTRQPARHHREGGVAGDARGGGVVRFLLGPHAVREMVPYPPPNLQGQARRQVFSCHRTSYSGSANYCFLRSEKIFNCQHQRSIPIIIDYD